MFRNALKGYCLRAQPKDKTMPQRTSRIPYEIWSIVLLDYRRPTFTFKAKQYCTKSLTLAIGIWMRRAKSSNLSKICVEERNYYWRWIVSTSFQFIYRSWRYPFHGELGPFRGCVWFLDGTALTFAGRSSICSSRTDFPLCWRWSGFFWCRHPSRRAFERCLYQSHITHTHCSHRSHVKTVQWSSKNKEKYFDTKSLNSYHFCSCLVDFIFWLAHYMFWIRCLFKFSISIYVKLILFCVGWG